MCEGGRLPVKEGVPAVAANLLFAVEPPPSQVLTITFPAAKYGGLQQRSHTVLAPPGQQADEAFVEKVYQVGAKLCIGTCVEPACRRCGAVAL